MKQRRKRYLIAAVVSLCLFTGAALSNPGRVALSSLVSAVKGERPEAVASVATPQAGQDLEQRARARHGWSAAVLNSVVRGTITFYDRDGSQAGQANLTLYRQYPNRLRVELDRGGTVQTVGYNALGAWRAGSASLSEEQARDIRAWLRVWPDRLFVTRGGGGYREAGRRVESIKPGRLGQPPTRVNPPTVLEQVQMEDDIGLPPTPARVGDRRLITYSINSVNSTIESARWLEPDDPRRNIEDASAAKMDVRVDFADWRTVNGVLWPYDVTHWLGGKVDFRIQVTEVRLNQLLAEQLFVNPDH